MLKSCVTTLHMRTVMLLMFSIMLATSAYAETPQNASPQTNRCNSQIHEEPTLSVTFNYIATSFPEAKTLFDKNANEINSLAQQQHITKFELQNMSYNINEINNENQIAQISVNGNMSYRMDSTNNALKLAEVLRLKKLRVEVSVVGSNSENAECVGQ